MALPKNNVKPANRPPTSGTRILRHHGIARKLSTNPECCPVNKACKASVASLNPIDAQAPMNPVNAAQPSVPRISLAVIFAPNQMRRRTSHLLMALNRGLDFADSVIRLRQESAEFRLLRGG